MWLFSKFSVDIGEAKEMLLVYVFAPGSSAKLSFPLLVILLSCLISFVN